MDHAALKIEQEELRGRAMDLAAEGGLKPNLRERILLEAALLRGVYRTGSSIFSRRSG